MAEENANIRQLFRGESINRHLNRQIVAVLQVMLLLTALIAVAAWLYAGVYSGIAALAGGFAQIAALTVYRIAVRGNKVQEPKAALTRHFIAQVLKVMAALFFLLLGFYFSGDCIAWFVAAFSINLLAYWLVLILA